MKVTVLKDTGKLFLIGFLLALSNGLYAQTTYSLNSLTDSATKNLPLLQQKRALVSSAKAGITDARNSFLPKFIVGDELSVGSANDVQGGFLPVSGIIHPISGSIIGQNNTTAQAGNLASAYAEYDLVNFGLRGAKVNNAVAYADLQQADFDKELYIVKTQVGKVYFDILKNAYLLNIDRQNISRYQNIYNIIKALTGSGIKAGVDSSLAIAELSKTKVAFNQRNGVVNQLRQQLGFLTGISATRIAIDTTKYRVAPVSTTFTSQTTDTTHNPLLDYFNRQRAFSQSNENVIRKSYLPKIVVGAGGWARGSSILYNGQYSALNNGLGLQRFNYISGVGITYDLFGGIHQRDKLAESRYQTQAADFGLQQQRDALANAAAQAQVAISTDEQNLTELPLQIKAATDAYLQKTAQYQAGVINLIDLLNASFVLYTAQQTYVQTLTDWYNANLDKAAATGGLNLFIQNLK